MQNVSSRYRLKHKFLKRCDTRTPRHNLTNGVRRGVGRWETGQICANRAISSQIYGPVKIGRRDTRHTMNRQRRSSATRAHPGCIQIRISNCQNCPRRGYRLTVSGDVLNRSIVKAYNSKRLLHHAPSVFTSCLFCSNEKWSLSWR